MPRDLSDYSLKQLTIHFSVFIFVWFFGIIDVSTIKCWELSTPQAGARGREGCSTLNFLSFTNYLSLIDYPVRALSCALSCFYFGSSWAPCHWLLLLGRVGAVFIWRCLSLVILFIIFYSLSLMYRLNQTEFAIILM
jgi:hypothetical protein